MPRSAANPVFPPTSCDISLLCSRIAFIAHSIIPTAHTFLTAHWFPHAQPQRTVQKAEDKDLPTWLRGAGFPYETSSCYWTFWSAPSPASLCTGPAGQGWGTSLPVLHSVQFAPSTGRQGQGVSLSLGWKAAGKHFQKLWHLTVTQAFHVSRRAEEWTEDPVTLVQLCSANDFYLIWYVYCCTVVQQ